MAAKKKKKATKKSKTPLLDRIATSQAEAKVLKPATAPRKVLAKTIRSQIDELYVLCSTLEDTADELDPTNGYCY